MVVNQLMKNRLVYNTQERWRFLFATNVLRLCVCLPLAQSFKLPQMLMGQIAQNRC